MPRLTSPLPLPAHKALVVRQRRSWLRFMLALAAILLLGAPAGASGGLPAPGSYAVDPSSSRVEFRITEFLVNTVTGHFRSFSGTVVVGDSLATSHVSATVEVASVETGVHARDEHLHGADYFDAAQFPTMTFSSTSLWGTPGRFGMKGNLTIKGIAREVTFSARVRDDGLIEAETTIDRSTFGMTAGATIKNDVHLRLEIRLTSAPHP